MPIDEITVTLIIAAKHPEDIFGTLALGSIDDRLDEANRAYRRISKVIHPDKFADGSERDQIIARSAFTHLSQMKTEADGKIRAGTYGNRSVKAVAKDTPAPIVITRGKRRYVVGARMCTGDVCDLYHCTESDADGERPVIFKIAQSPTENDIVQNEAAVLTKIYPPGTPDEMYYRYFPCLVDQFTLRSPARSKPRQVNVLSRIDGYVSLADVLKAYPAGIDFRDAVWMLKRMLSAIGFAHVNNVVHGALLPPHVLVHPTTHGAKILGWSYAVDLEKGGHVKAISPAYKNWYAPEILAKMDPGPATDMFMWGMCAAALLSGDIARAVPDSVPRELRGFIAACRLANPRMRPQDAWATHKDFDALLERLVGRRMYRPFTMPS